MHADAVHRWRARPLLAGATGGLAYAVPVAVSAAAVSAASLAVPPPRESLPADLVWCAAVSVVAMAILVGMGRLTRRLMPLAALMRVSLVFPDAAPSRFRLAMRTGTVETLAERLARARDRSDVEPAEAARLLLGLVAMLDGHDRLTRGHSERVRGYAQAIGRELGLERTELDLLNWSALLHDVGKLEVPSAILTKDGVPTPKEWEILRRHPELGERLVAPLREWLGDWAAAVAEHHERWDGTGYPRGLSGTEISLGGRIVAVADVFDVITSERSYKRPSTPSAARAEITRGAGTQFDPDVVRAFLAMSVRRSRPAGVLAWLAQAPVLARILLVPAATTATVGAVTVASPSAPQPALAAPARPPATEARRPEPSSPSVRRAATASPKRAAADPARTPPRVVPRPPAPRTTVVEPQLEPAPHGDPTPHGEPAGESPVPAPPASGGTPAGDRVPLPKLPADPKLPVDPVEPVLPVPPVPPVDPGVPVPSLPVELPVAKPPALPVPPAPALPPAAVPTPSLPVG